MKTLEKRHNNNNDIEKRIIITLYITILFLIFSYYLITHLMIGNKLQTYKNFNVLNIIMGLIAIPSVCLYYYMYKNQELFIFILSFISIFLEYVASNIITVSIDPNWTMINTPFIFRVVLLTCAIFYNNRVVKRIIKNKKSFISITIIAHIIFIYLEMRIRYKYNTHLSYESMIRDNIIIISYYYVMLLLLVKRALEQNKFIYMIFFSSISIFTFRRVVFISTKINTSFSKAEYNKFLSFVGFSIIILGLFIEVAYKIKERDELLKKIEKNQLKINSMEEDLRELKEVEKIRGQFFANLSHEFKTPVNIIFSCIQLLDLKKNENDRELAASYRKYDHTLKQNCNRMIRLVNNLVDITKMESGYMILDYVNCNIVELIENITLSIIPYIENKKINIIFDTTEEELYIKCDPEAIERVMLNLLSNAIKFTSNGGNILVEMDADEDNVIIKVKDDGIGIAEQHLEKIFEKFIQGDKSLKRKTEGSGIGLSLVKSLIELHEGDIKVSSKENIGTEFTIKLPNKQCHNQSKNNGKVIKNNKDNLVQRIHIEFSDIYDL